jgi:hypothetical protein
MVLCLCSKVLFLLLVLCDIRLSTHVRTTIDNTLIIYIYVNIDYLNVNPHANAAQGHQLVYADPWKRQYCVRLQCLTGRTTMYCRQSQRVNAATSMTSTSSGSCHRHRATMGLLQF